MYCRHTNPCISLTFLKLLMLLKLMMAQTCKKTMHELHIVTSAWPSE